MSEALYSSDPDGLGIEVYADRSTRAVADQRAARSRWRPSRSTCVRSMRAAGGEPWTGMPAGTTIGHVHFPRRRDPRGRGVLSLRARLRQSRVDLSGRAVLLCGWLPPSRRHEHVGRWRARATGADDARPRMGAAASDREQISTRRSRPARRVPAYDVRRRRRRSTDYRSLGNNRAIDAKEQPVTSLQRQRRRRPTASTRLIPRRPSRCATC